jgi:hypothetical protein
MAQTTKRTGRVRPPTVSLAEFERAVDEMKRLAAENAQLIQDRNAAEHRIGTLYREYKGEVQGLERRLAIPTRTRTVVREVTYEGDPEWIEKTLATSLREGMSVLTGDPAKRRMLTVRTVLDRTAVVHDMPSGVARTEYTVDKPHFTDPAYQEAIHRGGVRTIDKER